MAVPIFLNAVLQGIFKKQAMRCLKNVFLQAVISEGIQVFALNIDYLYDGRKEKGHGG
jgi:hypothetical protein